MRIRASAPGKIIIHGEHAVVHGAPALAAAIDRRTYVTVSTTPSTDSCLLRILGCDFRLPHAELRRISESSRSPNSGLILSLPILDKLQRFVADYVKSDRAEDTVSIVVFAYLFVAITNHHSASPLLRQSFEMVIESELPIGAGLGSSASFCAATAGAIWFASHNITLDDNSRQTLNQYAFEAERIVHGIPSGIDNFVVIGGGSVLYRVGCEPQRLPAPSGQRVIVVETLISRSTRTLVEKVHQFRERHPELATKLFEAIGQISQDAVERLKRGTSTICPELVRVNQHLLNGLGVGHRAIDQICSLAEQNGMAAKLTGAGGGGCVICIVPGACDTEPFMLQIREAGFRAFETTFCSDGLDAHSIDA